MRKANCTANLDSGDVFDPAISDLIRMSARKLSRSPGFNIHEAEDIEQDLIVHLWRQWDRFDPDRAPDLAYANALVKRKIISIVRHRFAQRRDPRREERSLDAGVTDGDGRTVACHETIASRSHDFAALDLRNDVGTTFDQLPKPAREEAVALLRQCQNGRPPRTSDPTSANREILWREFSTLVDGVPPVRI